MQLEIPHAETISDLPRASRSNAQTGFRNIHLEIFSFHKKKTVLALEREARGRSEIVSACGISICMSSCQLKFDGIFICGGLHF